jgi:hypothetical protein
MYLLEEGAPVQRENQQFRSCIAQLFGGWKYKYQQLCCHSPLIISPEKDKKNY